MAGKRRQFGYALHESTRRGLCRLAFGLLGVAPLLFCVCLCAAEFLPSYHRARAARWENWFSSQLGITVEIASVETLSPERSILHGLRLIHPETKASIGRVEAVELTASHGKWHARLKRAELESRQLATAWSMAHDWFLCRPALHLQPLQLDIDQLVIHRLAQENTLFDISMALVPRKDAIQLDIGFHPEQRTGQATPAVSQPPPSTISILRNHNASRLTTDISLHAASPLACPLAASLVPAFARLGDAATFQGSARLQLREEQWSLELANATLQQLDLGSLSADSLVSGLGRVEVKEASIADGRINKALVSVSVGPGRISAPFLQMIGRDLDVEVYARDPVAVHAFDNAHFVMYVGPGELSIMGKLSDDSIIADGLGSLASRSAQKWNSIIKLDPMKEALRLLPSDENPSERTASIR